MNILVTGANGFIGKNLCVELSKEYKVFALVRNPSKASQSTNIINIAHDFTQPLNKSALPSKIDAVIHLAQSNQYRNFPDGMPDMVAVNLLGLTDILNFAKDTGCEYFVNFSSGSVYDPSKEDQSESADVNPQSAYPLTKYVSEKLVNLYSGYFKTLNLRLFFPYGPGQEGMLIPNLVNSVKSANPIGVQGDEGGLELCPIYISDVISVCEKLLNQQVTGVLNVGGIEQLRMETIGNEIGKALNKPANFNIDSTATPALFRPSLAKMQELLGDHQFTTFSEGIERVVAAS